MREPDARDSVRVLAIILLVQAGAGALGDRWGISPLVRGVLVQAVFLTVPLLYARLAGLGMWAASGFSRPGVLRLGLVLAASLGSLWLLKGLSDLDLRVLTDLGFPVDRETRQLTRAVGKAREQGGLLAAAVLVLAPAFCEEVFFRGIFFRGLVRSLGAGWALGVSTLVFAFWHEYWVQRVMMLFVGLYFGLVVWLAGSLWAGVAAHAANNLAVLAVTGLWGDRMGELRAPAGMMVLSAVLFGAAVGLLALERAAESPLPAQGSAGRKRPFR